MSDGITILCDGDTVVITTTAGEPGPHLRPREQRGGPVVRDVAAAVLRGMRLHQDSERPQGEKGERRRVVSAVEVMTVKVYRGGGRRYFSRAAAYHGAARSIVNGKCDCERDSFLYDPCGGPPDSCEYCSRADRATRVDTYRHRLIKRLARWLRWRDDRAAQFSAGVR